MFVNNRMSEASPLSLPCLVVCALATTILIATIKTMYTLGDYRKDRGNPEYITAMWTMSCVLVMTSCMVSIIKFVD